MATVTVATSNPSLSNTFFTFVEDNPLGPRWPREASFSSYLSAADDNFLRLSGELIDHHNPTSVQVTLGSGRKKKAAAQDDELDVFGAEKYFSGGMDVDDVVIEPEKAWKPSPHKEAELTGRRTRPGTPSASSEASGNSRRVLLRHAGRDRSRNSQRPPQPGSKKFLGLFPCACSDDSSVEVDKGIKEGDGGRIPANRPPGAKQVRPELWCNEEAMWRRASGASFTPRREDYFSFLPVLHPVLVGNSTVGEKAFREDQKMARIPSTDVFGAPFPGKEEVASSRRRSLTIMNPLSPRTGGAFARDDDVCSEASSDLFEIESFSTSTFPQGGGGGTSASTTCYEPSEASIEWSVVTASAANVSVASDGEASPPKARRADGRHHNQRSGGGLLMGCVSAKAVNVASNAYRVPEKAVAVEQRQRHKSMDAIRPEIRYLPESPRSVDFELGQAGHVLAARGIARPVPVLSPHFQHPY